MVNFNKKQQVVILSLVLLFFLGRVMGLHAHGHVEINHTHGPVTKFEEVHHKHTEDKTHLVTHMNDSHDLMNDHHEGLDKTFEIDQNVIIKKQNNLYDLTQLLFFVFIIIGWFRYQPSGRIQFSYWLNFQLPSKPYLRLPPLRAPPLVT